ncbi:uncharacterized protein B0T15DRAFT_41039 [Chaetomium strumarium]|uniref:MYND-type domain-containing protein n=1 Tax=Chaetomium strumarium TaxID=1170767 RepID=A0AAJ0H2B3_9PEZI|nr:hypothetical protein B0T15DRAFT_41039 [Chaetomium strumarium]
MDPSTSKTEAGSAGTPASPKGAEKLEAALALLSMADDENRAAVAAELEQAIKDNTEIITGSQVTPKAEEPGKSKDGGEDASETPVSTDSDNTITAQMGNMNLTYSPVAADPEASTPEPEMADNQTCYGIPWSVCQLHPAATVYMTRTLELWMARGALDFRHNPNFAAALPPVDNDEVTAMIIDDLERGERVGDPGKLLCVACEKTVKSVCNGCKHALYCSRECQVADWPMHKKVCKDFAGDGADDKRPSPEHRRILFFPQHSSKPEIRWALPTEMADDHFVLIPHLDHPDVHLFVTEVAHMGFPMHMAYIPLALKPLLAERLVGHGLVMLAYSPAPYHQAVADPRFVNQSILGLGTPGYWRPLYGPVVVFAEARRPDSPGHWKMLDFGPRDLNTFFRFYVGYQCICVADVGRFSGEVASGLRINDLKNELNVAMGVKVRMDPVSVPLCPFPRAIDYPTVLAFRLGLRWYIRPGLLIGLEADYTLWGDGNLRYLAYALDINEAVIPGADNGEEPSYQYQVTARYGPFAGSVLILHGSGNPVDTHHVLAFNAYHDEMYVKKQAPSKEGFQKFWARYKKALGGPVLGVPSPYKWEKPGIKDKLGRIDPDAIMKLLSVEAAVIWLAIMQQLNHFSTQTWASE